MVKTATTPTEETTPITTQTLGVHTLQIVLEGLQKRYDGVTREIDGNTYIPWNESVKQANAIFGSLGWSSEVREFKEVQVGESLGFRATVRVTVPVLRDVPGMDSYHDGVGYSEVGYTKSGRPLTDTAVKAAESDGISRALKKFGDAFGLYLYEKDATPVSSRGVDFNKLRENGTTTSSTTTATSNGNAPSAKQFEFIEKNFGAYLSADILNAISGAHAKQMLDALWKNHEEPVDILHKMGIPYTAPTRDSYPLPTRSR